MNYSICPTCKDVPENYYYPHDSNEVVSPLFYKMEPVGVPPNQTSFLYKYVNFLKCTHCNTYYSYENWQQGIGNIGEFDKIDRFSEIENGIIKPILEAKTEVTLKKAIVEGLEFNNASMADKVKLAFEAVSNELSFLIIFPVIQYMISYHQSWGHYWGCSCLRDKIRNNTAIPTTEVHDAIFKCFKIRIDHNGKKWEDPNELSIS
jgi:hypothetical protein